MTELEHKSTSPKEGMTLDELQDVIKDASNKIESILDEVNNNLPKGIEVVILSFPPKIETKFSYTGKYCSLGTILHLPALHQIFGEEGKLEIQKHRKLIYNDRTRDA